MMSLHRRHDRPHPIAISSCNTLSVESSSPPSFLNDACEPVEILPYLFLGSEVHASSRPILEKLGITSVSMVDFINPINESSLLMSFYIFSSSSMSLKPVQITLRS